MEGNSGTIDYHDLPEAEEMDLEMIFDTTVFDGTDENDGNKFVALVRHVVKPEFYDRYRHVCSWTIQDFAGRHGCIATYALHRLLPTTTLDNDGSAASPCARPLRHGETLYSKNEEGGHEIYVIHKFEGISTFHHHLSFDRVVKWTTYSLTVKELISLPQVFMYHKQNGIHQEITSGRIGEQHLASSEPKEASAVKDKSSNKKREHTGLFVMMRKRTLVDNCANADVVNQILNRLATVSVETQPGKCLSYDIHTSRHVGPDEQNKILEIGIWSKTNYYFDEHLLMPYVKQSDAINVAFQENNNDSAITFWELLIPHDVLEAEPDVSFMDDAIAAATSKHGTL